MRTAIGTLLSLACGSALMVAQERYVAARPNSDNDLVITLASSEAVIVPRGFDKTINQRQEKFDAIAVSGDGSAVGWLSYYPNCCTSYPIPTALEVYVGGTRKTFDPAIVAWDWCFVDGAARIAAVSSTVHGIQNEIFELWDIASGRRLEEFTWMDGQEHPNAPAWVKALKSQRAAASYDPSLSSHRC